MVSSSAVSKGSVTWTHDGPRLNQEAISDCRQIPHTPPQEVMDTETPKRPWTSLDQLALVDKAQGKQKFGRLGTGDHIFIVSMFRKPSNHSELGRARPTDTRRTTPQQIMVKEVSPVYPPLAPPAASSPRSSQNL